MPLIEFDFPIQLHSLSRCDRTKSKTGEISGSSFLRSPVFLKHDRSVTVSTAD
jgi:hypothetical protein